MKRIVLISIAILAISGCAKNPDSIAPVSMDASYQNVSCSQASRMLPTERSRLANLEARQRNAANGDAVGVFLIGVPVSSVSGGDQEGEVAVSKGKVLALENRLLACR